MKLKAFAFCAALSIFSIGCIKSTNSYVQPHKQPSYSASLELEKPKDQVWKELISSLGSHFFVINNLDKESGLINVSYSGDPEKYVDCGLITHDFENARGPRHYEFPGSRANADYETTNSNNALTRVNRKLSLDGRINIIVESLDTTHTKVMVNVKYVLTKSINGQALVVQQNFSTNWVTMPPFVEVLSINTNQDGKFPNSPTECRPTGALEQEILALLKH